jgi:hypothetical protein
LLVDRSTAIDSSLDQTRHAGNRVVVAQRLDFPRAFD